MNTAQVHWFTNRHYDEPLVAIWPSAHDPLDAIIKFATHGQGTHAAFLRADGETIVENFLPRVRERAFLPKERGKVELYRIAGSTPDDWAALEHWFDGQLRNPPPYSVLDLFRYALDLPPRPGAACFCSRWVLRGIRECLPACKQPLARLHYPDWASPRDLRISPLLIRRRNECHA